jgi:hypothetical protein
MALKRVTEEGVNGEIAKNLPRDGRMEMLQMITQLEEANEITEKHVVVGNPPPMVREGKGKSLGERLREYELDIDNDIFSTFIEVTERERRLDKTGQVQRKIDMLPMQAQRHWNRFVTEAIEGNQAAYDGNGMFGSRTVGGKSQDNTIDAGLAASNDPTETEMIDLILDAQNKINSFVDESGDPMNQGAERIHVMVPTKHGPIARKAIEKNLVNSGESNILDQMQVTYSTNHLLDNDNYIYVFAADGLNPPILLKQLFSPELITFGRSSDYFKANYKMRFKVKAERGISPFFWESAVRIDLSS